MGGLLSRAIGGQDAWGTSGVNSLDGSGGWTRTNVPSFKGWCLRPLDYAAPVWRRAGESNARGDVITGLGLASQPLATRAALRVVLRRRVVSADSDGGSLRQKQPLRRQQCLKRPRGAARAWVVATELLAQLLGSSHDAVTAFDSRLGREALAPLAHGRESTPGLRRTVSWHTSSGG